MQNIHNNKNILTVNGCSLTPIEAVVSLYDDDCGLAESSLRFFVDLFNFLALINFNAAVKVSQLKTLTRSISSVKSICNCWR